MDSVGKRRECESGKGREWEDLEGVEWGGKGETKGWMGRWIGMERCGGGA
jgi:hypothetical protein